MATSPMFPPVVTVLGHVDHGKTTLLDAIRKTNIAKKEPGGITQKIGAYQIEAAIEGVKRKITFIDTPGHEAFLQMRGRGVLAADIVLLIVASDDGVMPQTEESIRHIQEAKTPFFVVLTKTDLPGSDPQKVRNQLAKAGVALEGYGGEVPALLVSAKEGRGIKELLEMILLLSELHDIKKNDTASFSGIVIESRLDPKVGPLISLIVKSGKLHINDQLLFDGIEAKVRGMMAEFGARLQEALPGDPVEIMGCPKVIPVGTLVEKKGELKEVKLQTKNQALPIKPKDRESLEQILLPVIIKADTEGSLEAIIQALPSSIGVINKATGLISESDVLLAKSAKAIVVGFNTKTKQEAVKLAETEGVIIKTYTIIHELFQEIGDVVKGFKDEGKKESGKAEVIGSFSIKNNKILGARVIEGYLAQGSKVKLTRKGQEVGRTTIISLRQEKIDKARVSQNEECGIILSPSLDFSLGDVLLSYSP